MFRLAVSNRCCWQHLTWQFSGGSRRDVLISQASGTKISPGSLQEP